MYVKINVYMAALSLITIIYHLLIIKINAYNCVIDSGKSDTPPSALIHLI